MDTDHDGHRTAAPSPKAGRADTSRCRSIAKILTFDIWAALLGAWTVAFGVQQRKKGERMGFSAPALAAQVSKHELRAPPSPGWRSG